MANEIESKLKETFPEMTADKVRILAEILSDRDTAIQLFDLISILNQTQ